MTDKTIHASRGAFGFGMLFWMLTAYLGLTAVFFVAALLGNWLDWPAWAQSIFALQQGAQHWLVWIYPVGIVLGLIRLRGFSHDVRWDTVRRWALWLFVAVTLYGLLTAAMRFHYMEYVPLVVRHSIGYLLFFAKLGYAFCLLVLLRQSGELLGSAGLVKLARRTRLVFWPFVAATLAARVLTTIYTTSAEITASKYTVLEWMGWIALAMAAVMIGFMLCALWRARRECCRAAASADERVSFIGELLEMLSVIPASAKRLLTWCREFGLVKDPAENTLDDSDDGQRG